MSATLITRPEVEDFLYAEAEMLDEWKLDEWFGLFEKGATYEVPTAGSEDDDSSSASLFYIADDYERLSHRVKRLAKNTAHAEWPRSVCVRSISNVRITEINSSDKTVKVRCTFMTHRSKNNVTHTFFGHHIYCLKIENSDITIVSKRTMLDMNSLYQQGRVSIIV